ncbi:uncharacterized protein Z520_10966 [Fonsecaea multimorphosa CBS 102226]|uniref:Telomerase reverse transcriptase n=1 Tax=Fonsecaea multimorphosa CBS 102226 TaxID=1442371 RepID=A0A0D2KA91_9EURO|nr:uncharacterized protein Z520_10966 [Fonsecaea multimorphosa CBS 102226]KIX93323.1 hypothetical protein Z520_10966 [Fonsecaea multimorphosa CBS 102226]OAL18561.1 hypothetical protein AYO22_10538 [Fonsecaea multimorphosa]
MARKRRCAQTASNRPTKQQKSANHDHADPHHLVSSVHHAVLSSYYPRVCTLRSYLLAALPATSRVRRHNLTEFGKNDADGVLDTCLVGILKTASVSVKESRKTDFATFTQSQFRATDANTDRAQPCCMNEVVDFVIWSLFKGNFANRVRPQHILCHGLQRGILPQDHGYQHGGPAPFLPGIIRKHPNDNLITLKSSPWSDILSLLGADGEVIFASLLLDCGVFTRIAGGRDNYFQLSGVPISELPQIHTTPPGRAILPKRRDIQRQRPGDIRFVRNRMFYARPFLNTVGKVKVGLHHTHILQRLPDAAEQHQAVHILKYIFPRQFGLHNVFTSVVHSSETSHRFKDYTVREQEITVQKKRPLAWAPRRLRGEPIRLVQKIYQNHRSCSYSQLLRHYCPLMSTGYEAPVIQSNEILSSMAGSELFATQINPSGMPGTNLDTACSSNDGDSSFLPHSTPVARVSAFCRSVISHLLPRHTFGSGPGGQRNHEMMMNKIDEFVRMRRFETMSLHEAVQGIHVTSIAWLRGLKCLDQKMSRSDFTKRLEIFHEFVYYVFDSLLIPIVRAHFYVTESSTHRHRLFYFRQDVWRKLSEPSLAMLRLNMYIPVRPGKARLELRSRTLGYSHLRLLPKDQGARPITNLRRRQPKLDAGRRLLGDSINAQLAPIFQVLNFERGRNPVPLGSALLSVGDIHRKVAEFKKVIRSQSPLFFVKVDIKSCFDTIPQEPLLQMASSLLEENSYRTTKHLEVKSRKSGQRAVQEGMRRRFAGTARPADARAVLSEASISSIASGKRHTVIADTGINRIWNRDSLLKLLQNHVGDNMIKIGKKYLKQIDGIPQGSIVSSLLCSYFYGAFERNELGFLVPESCLLLRLIDDFLLITTDDKLARRFLEVMASGDQRYGIRVNAEKSLVNFEATINSEKVPRIHGSTFFPYCGMGIHMETLELKKDREKRDAFISNALTVESCTRPGMTLKRKILSSLKLQMHPMLLDMSLNSRSQVVSTLLGNFTESAMKMHQYVTGLGPKRQPSQRLLQDLIEDLISAGNKICCEKNDNNAHVRHISRRQMCWIAATAFEGVLERKQSQYKDLLIWLRWLRESAQPSMNMEEAAMGRLVQENKRAFRSYVY